MTLVTSHMESNVIRCYPTRSRNEDKMLVTYRYNREHKQTKIRCSCLHIGFSSYQSILPNQLLLIPGTTDFIMINLIRCRSCPCH